MLNIKDLEIMNYTCKEQKFLRNIKLDIFGYGKMTKGERIFKLRYIQIIPTKIEKVTVYFTVTRSSGYSYESRINENEVLLHNGCYYIPSSYYR